MISQREKGELARFYTVTDPRKHEKGYTVYKVTARIISRKNPEDIQEITVWKRYSDFRKLHRDLWQIHSNLYKHSQLFPPFAKAKVFGRFDDSVVEERRQCSEDLLQFSANIPALYSSQHIEDFFKDGEVQDGSELIGPAEPFSDFLADSLSDCSSEVHRDIGGVDDLTISSQTEYGGVSSESELTSLCVDEDSLAGLDDGMASGGLSPNHVAAPTPSAYQDAAPATQLREAPLHDVSRNTVPANRTPPEAVRTNRTALFPNALKKRRDYLERAGELIRLANQKEEAGDVETALSHYRSGVDLLLQGVQGEVSPSRREAVKRKTAEYLMHAEQLANQHAHIQQLTNHNAPLHDIMGQNSSHSAVLGTQCCRSGGASQQQSQNDDLNNYRVLGVIDKVLLVMDKRTQETFILKGLRKSSDSGRVRKTIVPQSVPHMVPLRKVMLAEDSIFLLLEYAEGGKLWCHISKYLCNSSSDEGSLEIPFIQQSHKHTTATQHSAAQHHLMDDSASSGGETVLTATPKGGLSLAERRGGGGGGGEGEQQEQGEDERCTNSYLTLCNEYEQEKVEPEEEEEEESNQETSGLSVTNGDSSITVAMPTAPRTKMLLSNDSLSSGVGVQEQDEGEGGVCGRDEEVFSSLIGGSPEPISSEGSLECSKRSPMELFRIDSRDSGSDPLVAPGHDPCLSTSDLGSSEVTEATEPLLELAQVPEVKGRSCELWSAEQEGSGSVPVISFSEALGLDEVATRTPDLLANLPAGVALGRDTLEVELVAAGGTLAIEPSHAIGRPRPDVLQLEHDMGEEAHPDWSLELDDDAPSLSLGNALSSLSLGNALSSSVGADSLGCSCSPLEPPGLKMATAVGDKMAAGCSGSNDFAPIMAAAGATMATTGANMAANGASKAASCIGSSDFTPIQVSGGCSEPSSQAKGLTEGGLPLPLPGSGSGLGSVLDSGVNGGPKGSDCGPDVDRTRNESVSALFRELDELHAAAAQVRIPEPWVQRWAAQLVIALDTLHQQGLICRDLNPNNLLLNHTGHIQLTFFCSWSEVEESYDRDAITRMYCAPEVGGISEETAACDWWSLGAILFELLTGKALHQCHPAGISRHTFLSIPDFVSEEARSLLTQLLQYNPAERLGAGVGGAEDIKSHPFFSSVTWP
ncbi:ribosomal protein S6 kinase delta-1 [Engraulis encrasicolus]|uniref:ribosomal protein S6 kinase delta-1 n=1 Tax=Engraulis encrasicolus TaxID=184585 RepID=UPI002FD2D60B